MQTIEQINGDLKRIWEEHIPAGSNAYSPMQYRKPKRGALVFVGLNPSFSPTGWRSLLKHSDTPDLDPHSFFSWPSPQNFDVELVHRLEAEAEDRYSFFAPHRKLAGELKCDWVHLDLFAYRVTEQAKLKARVLASANDIALNEFGIAQFKVFSDLLALSEPSAVVVINALASQIYASQRKPAFEMDTGYYLDSTNGHAFPVFFSGMLTGARALDRFSRERLYWHVCKTLRNAQSLEPPRPPAVAI